MQSHVEAGSHPSQREGVTPRSLEELLDLDERTLAKLYAGARVPRLSELSGDLRGRMLAVAKLPASLATIVRMLAASDLFPWRGKSFRHANESEGEGINRVVSDAWRWFRFHTSIGRSRAGDFDAVQLDYALPENPPLIRAVRDEIREIAPGLHLGQAYLLMGGTPHLILYFGLAK